MKTKLQLNQETLRLLMDIGKAYDKTRRDKHYCEIRTASCNQSQCAVGTCNHCKNAEGGK